MNLNRPTAIVERAAELMIRGMQPNMAMVQACREVPSTPADQDSAVRAWVSLMRKAQGQNPTHPKNPPGGLTRFDRAPHSQDSMPRHKTPTLMVQAALLWTSLEPDDQQDRVIRSRDAGQFAKVEVALLRELLDSRKGSDGVPMLSKLALRTFQDAGLLALAIAKLAGHKNPAQALEEKAELVKAERDTGGQET